jgi:uncharacterized protein (TIGR03437 family)
VDTARKALLGFVLMAGTLGAQNPSFTGVVNAASEIPPGMPNYGIAQGSVFVIYGSNMGPAALVSATLPLPTLPGLEGTSITITVGNTAVQAPIVYTSAAQVAAIMPSTTPVGAGILQLTYNGNSGSIAVTVVATNFGVSTVNYSGSGAAVVTFANNQLVTNTNSAAPGDELVMWGTGLGPLPAGQSDTTGAAGGNLPTSILVFVGQVEATILYQGRTPTAVGLDQINFKVPQGAPLGCNIAVTVLTNGSTGVTSNSPTISLAASDGLPCSDPTQIIPTSYLSRNSVKVAYAKLKQGANLNVSPGNPPSTSTTTSAKASAAFFQFSQAQLMSQFSSANTEPTLGTCLTGIVPGSGSNSGAPIATYLNGGTTVTLTPPSGPALMLPMESQGGEIIYQDQNLTPPIPSGTWGFSNSGGADVSPLNFNFPVAAQVTWTNEVALATGNAIPRSKALTITWTGGDANGFVDILGQAQIGPSQNPTFTFYFDCSAPTAAGQFIIYPSTLLAMPAGVNTFASIQVSTVDYPVPSNVSVTGFDVFVDDSAFQVSAPALFQ